MIFALSLQNVINIILLFKWFFLNFSFRCRQCFLNVQIYQINLILLIVLNIIKMDMDALITLITFYFFQYFHSCLEYLVSWIIAIHKYIMILSYLSIPKFKLIHFKLENCNIYALKNANEITKVATKYWLSIWWSVYLI